MGLLDRLRRRPTAEPVEATPQPPAKSTPRKIFVIDGAGAFERAYNAASLDRLSSTFANTPRTFDSHVYASLKVLRARCREASRDEGLAKRFLGLLGNNVVGPDGIQLQAQPRDEDGNLDQLAADAIEDAWSLWSRPATADIRGQLNWPTIQKLALRTVARDGEVLLEEVIGSQAGAYGYSLQLVDPELLDLELNSELGGGRRITMGVEFDAYSRPVAYHLIDPAASHSALTTGGYYHAGQPHRRVPASRMIHLFLHEDPWQTRGVPWMAAALARMQQLGAGLEAATVNFRVGALKVAFIETPEGELETTSTESDGSPLDELEPGTMEILSAGQKVHGWDPKYPDGELADFVKGIKRDISSGLETSYMSLSSDLEGVSFSAGRLGRLDDIDVWQGAQAWLSYALNQRVYERWLAMALTAGAIRVPARGGGEPKPLGLERIEKYRNTRWQGRGWDSVDELKTTMAAGQGIALGLTTISEQIRKRGRDPMEVFEERAAELDELDRLGIRPPDPAPLTAEQLAGVTGDAKED